MPQHDCAARVRGGANQVLGGPQVQPFYIGFDGETIATLPLIVAAEASRRWDAVARVAGGAR